MEVRLANVSVIPIYCSVLNRHQWKPNYQNESSLAQVELNHSLISILQGISYLTMFFVPYSAEKTKLVEVLDHFFRQRPVDSDDDDGDDNMTLDCWELKDPNRDATWTTLWASHTANLVFAMTFKGDVKDPQHLDFETKIIEFDNKSEDKIKIFCSSTRPDPYHFTIVIDTIKCPFSIVDCFASLQASSFDDVVKALEEEIIEKKWQTKKGEALKAKPLAKKLRNVVGALDIAAAVAKAKISRPRKGPLALGGTGTRSQVHSQPSIQVQTGVQRASRSNVQKSPVASASPSKKRAPGPKDDAARGSKKNKLLSKEELSTSLVSVMSELPEAARHGEVIDYNNVNVIFQKFFIECQDAFVFDDPRQKIELEVMRLVNAPDAWTIRAFEERGMEDLKMYLMTCLTGRRSKRSASCQSWTTSRRTSRRWRTASSTSSMASTMSLRQNR